MPKNISSFASVEQKRLSEGRDAIVPIWDKWGPYVAERAWGTVREDYSAGGDAWSYFPHDRAISKTYRWGDDAIAGWCDRYQVLLFAPTFWNEHDSILKERLFGLNSHEGNHGEDVKEYYYYLDGTPTHSYMKYLYKYPHGEFPYQKLREENQKRTTHDSEYELVDTGIFEQNRYFDIYIEYAKAGPEDTCIRIEAFNRGNEEAPLHILPHLWFRNQWCWGDESLSEPTITKNTKETTTLCLVADDSSMRSPSTLAFDYHLGKRYLYGPKQTSILFTNNETNFSTHEPGKYYKDAFHKKIVHGEAATNPKEIGTKACIHYRYNIPANGSVVLYLRLTDTELKNPLQNLEEIFIQRREEADAFYAEIQPKNASAEEKKIQRHALAGMLWTKQIYLFDVNLWMKGDNTYNPPPACRYHLRNVHWHHLNSMRILSMPDKWEYPYFCAWDHAFQCVSFGLIDIRFAKDQLWLLLFDQFQHPNGQIPACEWEFSDLNPPVQSWAALRLYQIEKERFGVEDRSFLEKCFHKLLINFAWWVNKVDNSGNNVFEGGFLGLDNITVLDRSIKFPGGVSLQQSDGTGWMAMFCLNLMRIALILAEVDSTYEVMATKFFEHYVYIAHAMKCRGNRNYEMWSERDGFFYDVLTYPDGNFTKFRLRSLVGIIPLYAVELLEEEEIVKFPDFHRDMHWFIKNRADLVGHCVIPVEKNNKKSYVLALMTQEQLKQVLRYVWDPQEFRSEFGLRSLSKFHKDNPFVFQDRKVGYEPAESLERIKGGNSNWRGPIWMPTTFLLIDSLKKLSIGFRQEITVDAPGQEPIELGAMAAYFANRLISLFATNLDGSRPYLGENFPFKHDPCFNDHTLFYEYYNAETGQGLGASHQTGWSGLVANLIDEFRR